MKIRRNQNVFKIVYEYLKITTLNLMKKDYAVAPLNFVSVYKNETPCQFLLMNVNKNYMFLIIMQILNAAVEKQLQPFKIFFCFFEIKRN